VNIERINAKFSYMVTIDFSPFNSCHYSKVNLLLKSWTNYPLVRVISRREAVQTGSGSIRGWKSCKKGN